MGHAISCTKVFGLTLSINAICFFGLMEQNIKSLNFITLTLLFFYCPIPILFSAVLWLVISNSLCCHSAVQIQRWPGFTFLRCVFFHHSAIKGGCGTTPSRCPFIRLLLWDTQDLGWQSHSLWLTFSTDYHRTELEGAYKALVSKLLLSAGKSISGCSGVGDLITFNQGHWFHWYTTRKS